MTIRFVALLLALLCCLPASAPAADDEEGAYLVLNVGKASVLHGCSNPGVGANCAANKGFAYFATYGYQYTPMWGLEANFGKSGSVVADGYSLRALSLTVEAVVTLRMSDTFAVFGKAGMAYTDFNTGTSIISPVPLKTSGYSPAGGIGLQFDFTPKLALRAQADYFGAYTLYSGSPKATLLVSSIGLMTKY